MLTRTNITICLVLALFLELFSSPVRAENTNTPPTSDRLAKIGSSNLFPNITLAAATRTHTGGFTRGKIGGSTPIRSSGGRFRRGFGGSRFHHGFGSSRRHHFNRPFGHRRHFDSAFGFGRSSRSHLGFSSGHHRRSGHKFHDGRRHRSKRRFDHDRRDDFDHRSGGKHRRFHKRPRHGRHHRRGRHDNVSVVYYSLPYYDYYGYPYYYYPGIYNRIKYYPSDDADDLQNFNTQSYYDYLLYNDPYAYTKVKYYPSDDVDALQNDDPYRFRDIREKLERQRLKTDVAEAKKMALEAKKAAQKDKEIGHLAYIADAFLTEDYQKALLRSKRAVKTLPENSTLLFAHSQTLFANAEYDRAAGVLRQALRNIDPEEKEVFYFHDFYSDEDILTGQIDSLSQTAQIDPENADLHLLLGYQLMGAGELDRASQSLRKSQVDWTNKQAAAMLIDVLEKTRQSTDGDISAGNETEKSDQDY